MKKTKGWKDFQHWLCTDQSEIYPKALDPTMGT